MCNNTHKIDVDGGEAVEVIEGFCQTKSTWFPLFSRELIILETKRIAFGFIIFQFEKFYVKVS